MHILSKFAIATAISIALTSGASAACKQAAAAGTWLLASTGGALCTLLVSKTGAIQKSNCYSLQTASRESGLQGKLKFNKNCAVTGNLSEVAGKKSLSLKFTGNALDNGNTIIGKAKYSNATYDIVAFKQW